MSSFIGACLIMAAFNGCAFTNRDNTPLLNQVENHLWPDETALRVAVFPVVFPAGLAAILIDAFVVHPATVIGDATKDTGDVLWSGWEWQDHYITECATLPWRAVLTPLVFSGDFLTRAMFDVPRRDAEEREEIPREEEADRPEIDRAEARQEIREGLEEAQTSFAKGRYPEALQAITSIYRAMENPEYIEALAPADRTALTIDLASMTLDAVIRSGRYDLMPARPWPDRERFQENIIEDRLEAMESSEDPLARWTAFLFRVRSRITDDGLYERAREALSDPSTVLRHAALNWVDGNFTDAELRYLAPRLKEMAEKDPDPLNRARAGQVIARMK
jgi:hypothetical protein